MGELYFILLLYFVLEFVTHFIFLHHQVWIIYLLIFYSRMLCNDMNKVGLMQFSLHKLNYQWRFFILMVFYFLVFIIFMILLGSFLYCPNLIISKHFQFQQQYHHLNEHRYRLLDNFSPMLDLLGLRNLHF